MSLLTHKHKVKLARKLRTQHELVTRVSIWDSVAWQTRKAHRTGFKGGTAMPLDLAALSRRAGTPTFQKSLLKRIFSHEKANAPVAKPRTPQKIV